MEEAPQTSLLLTDPGLAPIGFEIAEASLGERHHTDGQNGNIDAGEDLLVPVLVSLGVRPMNADMGHKAGIAEHPLRPASSLHLVAGKGRNVELVGVGPTLDADRVKTLGSGDALGGS